LKNTYYSRISSSLRREQPLHCRRSEIHATPALASRHGRHACFSITVCAEYQASLYGVVQHIFEDTIEGHYATHVTIAANMVGC
jgi:hypothetical protein